MIDIDINKDYTMHKKLENGLYLSQEEIDILDKFNVNYMSVKSLKELIFILEDLYDETEDSSLFNLLDNLSERDYYENFNK